MIPANFDDLEISPKSYPPLSKPMLGTVQFGLNYGIANSTGKPALAEVCRMLELAVKRGVNCLDTASAYGESEQVLGVALRQTGLSGHLQICTKVHRLEPGLTTEAATKEIQDCLERSFNHLQVEAIDFCLFHRDLDYSYVSALLTASHARRIRNLGASISYVETGRQIAADGILSAIQFPSNLLDSRFTGDSAISRSKSLTHRFARSAYLQGALLLSPDQLPPHLSPIKPSRERLSRLAEREEISLRELAIRFAASTPSITSVVFGAETLSQLDETLSFFEKDLLPQALLAEIRQRVDPLPDTILNPALWAKS